MYRCYTYNNTIYLEHSDRRKIYECEITHLKFLLMFSDGTVIKFQQDLSFISTWKITPIYMGELFDLIERDIIYFKDGIKYARMVNNSEVLL